MMLIRRARSHHLSILMTAEAANMRRVLYTAKSKHVGKVMHNEIFIPIVQIPS